MRSTTTSFIVSTLDPWAVKGQHATSGLSNDTIFFRDEPFLLIYVNKQLELESG